jgi:hypothetical protein
MQHVLLINSDKLEPVRILAADPAIRLSVITKPKYAALYDSVGEVWPVDDVAHLPQVQTAAIDILSRRPIDAIITPIERSILTGGYLRSALALPGPGFDQTLRFTHKLVMKQHLRRAGLPTADFVGLERVAAIPAVGAQLGWPIIVKPAISSGSMHTFRVDSLNHWEQPEVQRQAHELARLRVPMLAERFIAMDAEYHCDGVVAQGEVVFDAVAQYFTPVLSSMDSFIGSYLLQPSDPVGQAIRALHRQVVAALELHDCVTHLEVFGAPGGLVVGEIACRPGGGAITDVIQRQYGVNMWQMFVNAALRRPYEITPRVPTTSYGWCGLPCANGQVIAMTPEHELRAIPGVRDVTMFYRQGDRVAEKRTSVFYSGVVFFEQPDSAQLETSYAAVQQRFAVETVAVD